MRFLLSRMAGLAAVLAALALANPREARANETLQDAGRCAVRYLQVLHSTSASQIIEGYENIDVRDRAWQLIRTHELAPAVSTGAADFTEDLNRFVKGQTGSLVIGRHFDTAILSELPLQEALDSGERSREEGAIAALAECDRTHGFTPVIALAPAHSISDLDCAAGYWLRGAMNPLEQAAAGERAQFALGRHQAENAGLSVEEIIGQVQAAGNARFERIMHESRGLEEFRQAMIADGQNPDDPGFTDRLQRRAVEARNFQQDIIACEAKYGFGQAGQ